MNSAERIRKASEEELFDSAYARLQEIASLGTGAVEIKSGYGLDTASELKMLRVIKRLERGNTFNHKVHLLGCSRCSGGIQGTADGIRGFNH